MKEEHMEEIQKVRLRVVGNGCLKVLTLILKKKPNITEIKQELEYMLSTFKSYEKDI